MPYIANTDADRREMLDEIGVEDFEDLLEAVPEEMRFRGDYAVPESPGESAVLDRASELSGNNRSFALEETFAGAGLYPHYIPPLVKELVSRNEFYTAYTPYQAEVSQGELQAMYEFQTYVCELTGTGVANSGGYDGATSFADALFMAHNVNRRERFLISPLIHPHYRETFATYNTGVDFPTESLPLDEGLTFDLQAIESELQSGDVSAVAVQQPNFLGALSEQISELAELCDEYGTMLVVIWQPLAAGSVARPGDQGADIVVGEIAGLGTPIFYGGPLCGFLASDMDYIRKMPGRIVGETHDEQGKRAFVLTLQTREQHIRRAKATSNICTNQALIGLMSAIYLSAVGKSGFVEVAERSHKATRYALDRFAEHGIEPVLAGRSYFNEFAVELPGLSERLERAAERDLLAGVPVSRAGFDPGELPADLPAAEDTLLLAFHEKHTPEQIDRLVESLTD